jgi:hypothetical protein
MEQSDIVEILKEFEVVNSKEGLIVLNPPKFEVPGGFFKDK